MITTPSAAQYVRAARLGLDTHVAPGIRDPHSAAALAQIGLVLRYVEAAIDGELRWLHEEIADVHTTAAAIVDAGADADGRLGQALADSRQLEAASTDLPSTRAAYRAATRLLGQCLEMSEQFNSATKRIAVAALGRRLDREAAIRVAAGITDTSRSAVEATGGRNGELPDVAEDLSAWIHITWPNGQMVMRLNGFQLCRRK